MVETLDTWIRSVGPIGYVALVVAAITFGSMVGAAINYFIGNRLAHRFERTADFAQRHPHIYRLQQRMRTSGVLLIALNRFMPGVRGLLFIAAGAFSIKFRRGLGGGTPSALGWHSLIFGVG